MGLPDVVYLVRSGHQNEELRHSLRSLANLPHGRVWLAGFQPRWTAEVGRIEVDQTAGKWANQQANLHAAASHPDVSDPFVLFNDDFFVMQPLEAVPVWHRGPFREIAPRYEGRPGEYPRRIRATAAELGGDALSYDAIHVPMTLVKQQILDTLEDLADGLLFRSVHGNRWRIGGSRHRDVKIARSKVLAEGPLTSTTGRSFRTLPVGKQIRQMFPDPGRYET